jgi:hypothetical protein
MGAPGVGRYAKHEQKIIAEGAERDAEIGEKNITA